jgi:hypothetical protein
VLRATLRGDSQVFYLTDRGADARVALRRLRADLDAVRAALSGSLIAAQATAVREARLAVLDQLRARLLGRPAEAGAAARPDSGSRLLFPALDLGAAGEAHRERELAYLAPLASHPAAVLGRWERELSGGGRDGPAAERKRDLRLRYCRRLDLDTFSLAAFLESYQGLFSRVVPAQSAADPAQVEDRERVLRWLDDHQALAARLQSAAAFRELFEGFLTRLREKLLTPWDRALKGRSFFFFRRQAASVALDRAERAALATETVEAGLDRLNRAVQGGIEARQRRARDFGAALALWRSWASDRAWLEGFGGLEADALRQRARLDESCRAWEQAWARALHQLRDGLARVKEILHSFDALLAARPAPEEVTVRLTRAQREGLRLADSAEALGWLERQWPAPGDRVEGIFALWELGLAS